MKAQSSQSLKHIKKKLCVLAPSWQKNKKNEHIQNGF